MENKKPVAVQGTLFPELEKEVLEKAPHLKRRKAAEEEKQALLQRIKALEDENKSLKQKAEMFDALISSTSLFTTTVVAKSFGWSAVRLNKYLHEKGIQFQQGDVWVLYAKYAEEGYTQICWFDYAVDVRGKKHSRAHTYWTAKGIQFIRELLKKNGDLPE